MASWFSFLFFYFTRTPSLFGGILRPARDMPVPMPNTSSASSSFARSFSVKNTSIGIWPHDAPVPLCEVCLVMVDLQQEFIGPKGYLAMAGHADAVADAREVVARLKPVLDVARRAGMRVVHTREGHRPSLADLHDYKKWRSKQSGAAVGAPAPGGGRFLVRGSPGWEIVPELAPLDDEDVFDKPGYGAFTATDLDHCLRAMGIKKLVVAGLTTEVCVHSTIREATDRGYECLLLEDCTAPTVPSHLPGALGTVRCEGGIFGSVGTAADAHAALLEAATAASNAKHTRDDTEQAAVEVEEAEPGPFRIPRGKVALLMIDWQGDFCEENGFGHALGNDCSDSSDVRRALKPAAAVLAAARSAGVPVLHTLEAHDPLLADCPPTKKRRAPVIGEVVPGRPDRGRMLVRGSPCNELCAEVAAASCEVIIHKPGKGGFCRTGLEAHLKALDVTHLIVTGVTTEVCVNTTMREANDRGFECLLVRDATASYVPEFKEWAIRMMTSFNGIVGWCASSAEVIAALEKLN